METAMVMRYVGISYKHQGRDMNGIDCWGLIKLIYKDMLGIEIWDIGENYTEDWSWEGKNHFIENYQKQWERVSEPRIFDGILINNGKGIANHAGVMLENGRFIHCIKAGVVISKITDRNWRNRIAGYFRYKK
jgi:cell wall-associated NlpC family hydrolase